jgi:hypothetical protein
MSAASKFVVLVCIAAAAGGCGGTTNVASGTGTAQTTRTAATDTDSSTPWGWIVAGILAVALVVGGIISWRREHRHPSAFSALSRLVMPSE